MKSRIITLLILFSLHIFAEKIDNNSETWFQIFANAKLTDKWSIATDFGMRRQYQFLNEHFQAFARAGVVRQFGSNSLTLGYSFFETDKNPEHRLFQFFVIPQTFGIIQLRHRYRFEQRWRSQPEIDSYVFNYRFGYQVSINIPLKGRKIIPKTPFLIVQDELFVNWGKSVRNNFFDQNRILAGFGYQFTNYLTANIGYQYSFVQRATPETFNHIHAIRINVIFNFDLRKKEVETETVK